MTALVDTFALIGRSFPSEKYQGLLKASVEARAERRTRRADRVARILHITQNAIVLPKRLSA